MFKRSEYIEAGYEAKKEVLQIFNKSEKLVIFDIGACEGEDSIRLSRLFPKSKIYTFEPLPVNQKRIKQYFTEYKVQNATLFPLAISNQDGEATFHVSSGAPKGMNNDENWDFGNKSSSLLPPEESTKERYDWLAFNEEITVETKTLDTFLTEHKIDHIDFIHLDVQGAELMVLNGAGKRIENIKAIYLEVEAVSLYKNQPLKNDVEAFMKLNGFYKIKDTVDKISGDQFYINSRYFGAKEKNWLKQKLSNLKNTFSAKKVFKKNDPKNTFSQCGEDVIMDFIFSDIGIEKPSYIDIGAHHPYYLSNTALFYKKGCKGVNIEPDPDLIQEFLIERPKDINLNIGIGEKEDYLNFYVMSAPTMNTFSKEEAERLTKEFNFKILRTEKVEVNSIDYVLKKYCNGIFPDLLSLDVEGLDEQILKSIDFTKSKPLVICIETISYSETGNGVKNKVVIDFLISKGYMLYADTYINSIFVTKDRWQR